MKDAGFFAATAYKQSPQESRVFHDGIVRLNCRLQNFSCYSSQIDISRRSRLNRLSEISNYCLLFVMFLLPMSQVAKQEREGVQSQTLSDVRKPGGHGNILIREQRRGVIVFEI